MTTIVIAWLLLAVPPPQRPAPQDARQFVVLRAGVTCDRGQNHQVFLANRHRSTDINATVRWRVAGGGYSTATFRTNAGAEQQIGCASDATIVRAVYLPRATPTLPEALEFVALRYGATCDRGQNFAVFLVNRHSSRAINATIRARPAGQPFRTSTFRIDAGREQQVGCAAEASITGATYITGGAPGSPRPRPPGGTLPPAPGPSPNPTSPALAHAVVALGRSCDGGQSNTVWLRNTHTSRALTVTVRWRVSGGASRTNTFRVGARATLQIGCAADVRVTAARFS